VYDLWVRTQADIFDVDSDDLVEQPLPCPADVKLGLTDGEKESGKDKDYTLLKYTEKTDQFLRVTVQPDTGFLTCYQLVDKSTGKTPVDVIEVSSGVNVDDLNDEILDIESMISTIFGDVNQKAKITKGRTDPGDTFSYHETGDGADVSLVDLSETQRATVVKQLRESLGNEYDVCVEVPNPNEYSGCVIQSDNPQVHVEYDRNRVQWDDKHSSVVPIPDLTPDQVEYITDYNRKIEEQRITKKTFLDDMSEAFKTRRVVYEEDYSWAPGLNVQVSTSPEEVALWGAKVVASPALEKLKGKITAFVLSPESQKKISDTMTVTSKAQQWYDIKKIKPEDIQLSGKYTYAPFTIVISYDPELIPEGKSEDDIGMFHAVWKEGTVTYSRLNNVFVDKSQKLVMGKSEGFSIFTVGVLTDESVLEEGLGDALKVGPVLIVLLVLLLLMFGVVGVIGIFMKRSVSEKTTAWGTGSLIISIIGLVFFFAPYLGLPFSVGAILFSRAQKKIESTKAATAGFVLGIIGTVLGTVTSISVVVVLLLQA